MAIYTSSSKQFRFPPLPNNGGKRKEAFFNGFVGEVLGSQMTSQEKVAWLQYAAEFQKQAEGPAGGAPGFVPEQQQDPGGPPQQLGEGLPEAGGEEELAQLLESLPGNTLEEKLQAALALLMQENGGEDVVSGEGDIDPSALAGLGAQQPGALPPGA